MLAITKEAMIHFSDMDATPSVGNANVTGNNSHDIGVRLTSSNFETIVLVVLIVYPIYLSIIVTGNGLVIFGLAGFKVLRHPSNIFVGVLSVVDITFSVSITLSIIQAVQPAVFRTLHYCQLRIILPTANLLASELALLGMYAFSCDQQDMAAQWN